MTKEQRLKLAKTIRKLVRNAYEDRHDNAIWQENPHEYFAVIDARIAEIIEHADEETM